MFRKTLIVGFLLSTILVAVKAQSLKYALWNDAVFLNDKGDTLYNSWVGGMNQAQFSPVDLNNDGKKDLVVFDRTGNKFSTFLNQGSSGTVRYVYDPRYEQAFPFVTDWALLVDMNQDGKEDLFHYGGNVNVGLYLNVTAPGDTMVRFVKQRFIGNDQEVSDFLQTYTFSSRPWADTSEVISDFSNIPAIADVDGDGDVDFLTLLNGGVGISLYKNIGKEEGKNLDNPFYHDIDWCWGDFGEGEFSNEIFLQRPQWCSRKVYKKHAGGSSLLLLDGDGDGDKDLILGNAGYKNLIYLQNGRIQYGTKQDTMISYDPLFPSYDVPAEAEIFPAAFYLDMDNDGKRDLVVGVNAFYKTDFVYAETDHQLFYRNTGRDDAPVFKLEETGFMTNDMVDFGAWAAPAFADIDGDGDFDLFIGNNGNYLKTLDLADRIAFFENTGSSSKPIFSLKSTDYASVSAQSLQKIAPHFVDVDNDGDLDLLIGNQSGRITLFRNNGTALNPNLVWETNTWQSIDVGENSVISAADINSDGLFDMLIGKRNGKINYYRNVGSVGSPRFVLESDTLGGVLLNAQIIQSIYDPTTQQWVDSMVYEQDGFSAPLAADLNDDGMLDLVGGAIQGNLRLFPAFQKDLNGRFVEEESFIYNFKEASYTTYDFGNYSIPAAADLDGDGTMEIVVGNSRGGINLLSINGLVASNPIKQRTLEGLRIYPNPSATQVMLYAEPGYYKINLTDLHGREVWSQSELYLNGTPAIVPVSNLTNGMYVLHVTDQHGHTAVLKLLKISN